MRPAYQADDGALIVFEQGTEWRLSFVAKTKVLDAQGAVTDQETAPKRFTYLLGAGQKVNTPAQRLSALQKPVTLQALFDAFSVEVLNREFYENVAAHFYRLVGKQGQAGLLQLPDSSPKLQQEFAVRLIGRIVFCWFLKMKRSESGVPLLPESLLSSAAVAGQDSYYHRVLERLFFQVLNTEMAVRRDDLPAGADTIPFLNGGLFEPQEDFFEAEEGTGVSKHFNTLIIPNQWFEAFFQFLEQYHFTLDENSLTDVEVSVDPEMLGRIFENLLAEIDPESGESARKATGSFYTPREIVDYMVSEGLMHALHQKTALALGRLRPLFQEGEDEDEASQSEFSGAEKEQLLAALDSLKILDPACGSGAFPMGILQKMLLVLKKIDPQAQGWIARQLARLENEAFKQQIQEKFRDPEMLEYACKMGIVQQAIYGVDLQPIATEIARLRCFLTLIVDEKIEDGQENRGIVPLPNLEFKFVTADALGKLPPQEYVDGLFDAPAALAQLEGVRRRYFQSSGREKGALKAQFEALQQAIYAEQMALGKGMVDRQSRPYLLSTWQPFGYEKADWFDPEWMFGVGQFDLVLGNPPYIQMQKNSSRLAEATKPFGYRTWERKGDIYALFYERSLELVRAAGHCCLITSNKWMRAGYGKSLRGFLAQHNPQKLLDLGPGIFTATVDTNILLVQRAPNHNTLQAQTLQNKTQLADLMGSPLPALPAPSERAWVILNSAQRALQEKIEQGGTPLKDWAVEIHYGIKTGYNEAFLLSTQQREALVAQDPRSAELLKPILRGRDIQRYHHRWAGLWVIGTFPALRLNIEDYPAIKNYLQSFRKRLEQSGAKGSRKKTQNQWFETQDQIGYYPAFEQEKVVWADIATTPTFSLLEKSMYFNNTVYMIVGDHLKYLNGVLNSRIVGYYFPLIATDLGKKGNRYFKQFVQQIPIPAITPANQSVVHQIQGLVDQILLKKKQGFATGELEAEVDRLVYALYGLSDKDIRIVEG